MAVIMYKGRGSDEYQSNDGGKTFTNQRTGQVSSSNSQNTPSSNNTSKQGYSSGNNQYTGKTGKQYNVSGSNGAITVNRPDGTSKTVQRGDADYQATVDAMNKDGVNYTPNTTYTNQNGTYTAKSYTAGNKDLQYALEQAAKTNPGLSVGDYAESLYNRVGSQRADGSTVSLEDVTNELTRLGLQDYLPGNAVYTASQKLLPGNEFGRYGEDANGDEGLWYFYGGQQYRVGGDQADFVNYVNGKTGNLNNNLSYIFGDMANNQYAQQDTDFMNAYNQALQQFYANGGQNVQNSVQNNTINQDVDNLADYVGSLGALSNATGQNNYASDLWAQIQALLQGGYDATNQFLNSQQVTAEKNAEDLARQAWVNSQLQGDYVREGLSAAGLGATGALQSAQLGVQNNFNNSLANINSNLNDMTTNLSEQKLAALTDYNNNLANYAYQIQNDEADRAYQNAQLAMQQQEYQNALQQQQWENAYQQQLLELQNQQYADSVAQQQSETDYERKAQQAEYYANLYNIGQISGAQYQQYLRSLGLI